MKQKNILYYIHDPMCSWCYGFKPILESLHNNLNHIIDIKYILGGLAKDSDLSMPDSMKSQIIQNWKRIEETIPGTEFNYDFWVRCIAKRSTYPSCRAVIAVTKQNSKLERDMIKLIQQAYYLDAMNPSDYDVLYAISKNLDIDHGQFMNDILSSEVNNELMSQIQFSRDLGADSFPSLYMYAENKYHPVVLDYNNADIILEHIKSFI